MKKKFLIIAAVIGITFTSQAQDILQSQIPSVIQNQFNSQFPKATAVEWEMDGSYYSVEFELTWNIDHEVWYNTEGKMVKHKEDISPSELPKVVSERIQTDFSGYSIDDLERITDNGEVVYKMELNHIMQQDWDVVIDANGKVLNKMAD
ncbi:MAG: PepSY-like domain-containing protein [Chitinophagales bacterium]|nr:PepSY-like domain-containing protein [Chitinophagales bacterium]